MRLVYLKERPRISDEDAVAMAEAEPLAFACKFYGIAERPLQSPCPTRSQSPIAATFEHLSALAVALGQALIDAQGTAHVIREGFVESLCLLTSFAQQLQTIPEPFVVITWSPSAWLSVMLRCIGSKVLYILTYI